MTVPSVLSCTKMAMQVPTRVVVRLSDQPHFKQVLGWSSGVSSPGWSNEMTIALALLQEHLKVPSRKLLLIPSLR